MKRIFAEIILLGFSVLVCPAIIQAATPDQFIGDTAIYGGQPSTLQPNVLIVIDTSGSMDDAADPTATGSAYDPDYIAAPYPSASSCNDSHQNPLNPCETTAVYDVSYGYVNGDVSGIGGIVPSCTFDIKQGNNHRTLTVTPQSKLMNSGQYNGPALTSDGTACCFQSIKIGSTIYPNGQCANTTYYLGNYINWYWDQPQGSQSKISIARDVIAKLIDTTYGVNFGVMTYQYTPSTGQGGQFLQESIYGTNYVSTVKTMEDPFTYVLSSGTVTATNRDALIQEVNNLATAGNTPTGEALFEAMRYFAGQAPAFGSDIGVTGGFYTSPIQYSCQKNYVILITDGMANADDSSTALNFISNKFGVGTTLNYDGGYCSGYGSPAYTTCNDNYQNHLAAGVARYMYEYDLKTGSTTTVSTQNNVVTYTIGFGLGSSDAEAVDLLRLTADDHHGRGANYLAKSAQTLNKNLTSIINKIYQTTGAFVAPVVPVNPENKLQFGSRVYMGFFQPGEGGFWKGNLKKFGLDANLNVVDVNGNLATYVDANGDGFDDRDNAQLSNDTNSGASDGSFRLTATAARSYWTPSGTIDSGKVDSGGVGGLLLSRPNTLPTSVTSAITGSFRNIYTYTGHSQNLTDPSNAFKVDNISNPITASMLGLPGSIITTGTTTDVKMLINYIHGFDTYDELSTGNTNTSDGSIKKRQWLMGDVLHSKPIVVSYATFSYPDEANCSINKNMIYVGTNDGMLHAFNDCDGNEAWAFIPPELLPYLQYLRSSNHAYFVDSSIQAYKFDSDPNDGAIGSSINDRVVLVVGLRRGGGITIEPGNGFYYILDVTNPTSPILLSRFSNLTTGFTDLGESWSEPKIGKIVVGSNKKLAAFIGGGYDNCNEDARFGATQSFSGTCINAIASADGGLDSSNLPITSSGSVAASSFSSTSYKGRGVYVVELATFPSTSTSGLDTSNAGSLIWSYTFDTGAPLSYSMLSEIAAIDFNGDGYVDRLYMGDAGGNVWRFNLSATSPTSWTVTKIFSSNPGSSGYPTSAVDNADIGRKIFYRPAVSPDRGMVWLFFGTGDREHPLNRAVEDRIYGLIDKGQTSAVTEAKLLDVTTDPIQAALTQSDLDTAKAKLDLVSNPSDTTYYGWYIRLDGGDRTPTVDNPGEKVLATTAVAAGNVFVTSYSPSTGTTTTATSTNPCQLGNLGNGALYVLNYSSGAAVVNYDPNNDPTSSTYNFNKYAFAKDDTGKAHVLLRTDRKRTIGSGIPSSAVVICDASDAACKWLVGCGGGICSDKGPSMDTNLVTPVYWRQK